MTLWAVVPAAGIGRRMGVTASGQLPKQYLPILGQPVLGHTLDALLAVPDIARIVVALHPEDSVFATLTQARDPRIVSTVGGAERQVSVLMGLQSLTDALSDDFVLVHDAVRPCVRPADIARLVATLASHPVGGLLGAPVDNTIKEVDEQGEVLATPPRSRFWNALTPQGFRAGLLRRALESAQAAGILCTDEAQAVERLGERPLMVAGDKTNIKITHASDLDLAAQILRQSRTSGQARQVNQPAAHEDHGQKPSTSAAPSASD